MATNGQISYGDIIGQEISTNGYLLSWERTSYSIADNTSTISWSFSIRCQISGTYSNRSYSVNIDGNTYTGVMNGHFSGGWNTLMQNTTIIPHHSDGTRSFSYSFDAGRALAPWVPAFAASGTDTLDIIPRPATISSATDFNDEGNPTITYSLPSGATGIDALEACISFTGAKDDVPYRAISKTGTSYTFSLTDDERATLRKGITSGNSITVRFYIRTNLDGKNYYRNLTKTFTLINYAPTLTPDIKDTNARTIALTGDSNKLIKYYSNASVTFGAVARKEATIVDRRVICGSKTIEIEDQAQDTVIVEGVDSNTFYMRARDSRDYLIERAPVKALVPYVKLTNYLSTGKLDSNGNLTFTVKGTYFNGSFGAKNNTLELEYLVLDENGDPAFNKDGSGWVQLGTVTPTMDGTRYTYSHTITGLDYKQSYTLTVNAIDELTPVQTSSKVVAGVPVFDWSKEDFNFNVPVDANKSIVVGNTYENGLGANDSGGGVYYKRSDGNYADLISVNNDMIFIGSENSIDDIGSIDIASPTVEISADELNLLPFGGTLNIKGREYGENKVLWSNATGWYMKASQTVNLSEAISKQPNGIMLVFSLFDPTTQTPSDVSINSFFVSKKEVELLPGAPHTYFMMINSGFSVIGSKYLYIDDTTIKGHDTNATDGTSNNMTFTNKRFVLRYVIGV